MPLLQGKFLELTNKQAKIAVSLPPLTKRTAGKWGYAAHVWIKEEIERLDAGERLHPHLSMWRKEREAIQRELKLLAQKNPNDQEKALVARLTRAFGSIANYSR
jgi:hypothetical protein